MSARRLNPCGDNAYDGVSLSPLETMFVKVKGFQLDVDWAAARTAAAYDRWLAQVPRRRCWPQRPAPRAHSDRCCAAPRVRASDVAARRGRRATSRATTTLRTPPFTSSPGHWRCSAAAGRASTTSFTATAAGTCRATGRRPSSGTTSWSMAMLRAGHSGTCGGSL